MTVQQWELAVLGVALLVVVTVANTKFGRRRVAELTALARHRGWVYQEHNDGLARRYLGKPFRQGKRGQTRHVFTGTHRGREFVAFEYFGDKRRPDLAKPVQLTPCTTVVALNTPAVRPTLDVSRHDLDSKLLGLVGARYLRLESEKFNDAFVVLCDNERFAYDVLHPRMMEWLLADQRAEELPFRFERADLLTCRPGQLEPGPMLGMLNYLCDVLERVPSFVWKP